MGAKIVSILILMCFVLGEHTEQDGADLEARPVLDQASWVNLGPLQFGGVPRQRDVAARTLPLEILTTLASSQADSTQHSTLCAYISRKLSCT